MAKKNKAKQSDKGQQRVKSVKPVQAEGSPEAESTLPDTRVTSTSTLQAPFQCPVCRATSECKPGFCDKMGQSPARKTAEAQEALRDVQEPSPTEVSQPSLEHMPSSQKPQCHAVEPAPSKKQDAIPVLVKAEPMPEERKARVEPNPGVESAESLPKTLQTRLPVGASVGDRVVVRATGDLATVQERTDQELRLLTEDGEVLVLAASEVEVELHEHLSHAAVLSALCGFLAWPAGAVCKRLDRLGNAGIVGGCVQVQRLLVFVAFLLAAVFGCMAWQFHQKHGQDDLSRELHKLKKECLRLLPVYFSAAKKHAHGGGKVVGGLLKKSLSKPHVSEQSSTRPSQPQLPVMEPSPRSMPPTKGRYRIAWTRLPVTEELARQSKVVGYIDEGETAEVTEIGESEGRWRGCVNNPHGWISLRQGSHHFVVKVVEVEEQTSFLACCMRR